MKLPTILYVLLVTISACAGQPVSQDEPADPSPTSIVKFITPEPIPSPVVRAGLPFVGPEELTSVTSFADIPGNQANGEPVADFTAPMMGGGTFTLSEQRGSPVLLLPTAAGCSECVYTLHEIGAVYPDYRESGVKMVVFDLYPGNKPEVWQEFAEQLGEPDFIWSVATSTDFIVNHNIRSLGTTFLIDPDGKLVFRSDIPISADGFRQLFELATQ